MKKYIYLIIVLSGFNINPLLAAPTGGDLLNACESALKVNSADIDAKMCDWYVTPCDCSVDSEVKLPRVCLAEDYSTRTLAMQVIEGLIEQPELQKKDAGMAASTILSRHYPCDDG